MGYKVSSVFSVSPNDAHNYFVYFIPGRRPYDSLSTDWINEWIYNKFDRIAGTIGKQGVLVLLHQHLNSSELRQDSLEDLGYCLFSRGDAHDHFLHAGMPFLIISRKPLVKNAKTGEAIAINLVQCKSESELANVFDIIIAGIREDDWNSIVDRFPLQSRAQEPDSWGGWADTVNRMLELKPNIFGLGVNLNGVIDKAGEALTKKHRGESTSFFRL